MGFNFKALVDYFKNKKKILLYETKSLENYRNQIFAIDTSIFLYKYVSNSNISYLELFLKQILLFKKYNITPIYVFEGKPPEEKRNTLQQRFNNKEKLKNEINELLILKENEEKNNDSSDDEQLTIINNEILKKQKRCISITSKHNNDLKLLFDNMNIIYIDAPSEAEVFCVNLIKNNIANACLSEDYDVLANGGRLFLKNFNIYTETVIEYDLNFILNKTNLTYPKLVDICILTGCDYLTKIKGIGPIIGYKLIIEHHNIDNIILFLKDSKKYKVSNEFNNNFVNVRNIFINNHIEFDYDNINNLININNKYNINNIETFFKNYIPNGTKYISIIKSY
jgi:flap endonuclease-1